MKLSESKLNLAAIDTGVWIKDPADDEGFAVLVKGRRSKDYQRAQGAALAKARKASRKREIDVATLQQMDSELVGKYCLLDWKNLVDDNGQIIPYTSELAKKLMEDREYGLFQEFVKYAVDRVDENDLEDVEEIKGNSAPSSLI